MTFDYHEDRKLYFENQRINASNNVIPFLASKITLTKNTRVMEIGCAEGGVLKAFLDRGCFGTGIELDKKKVAIARKFMKKQIEEKKLTLHAKNIYDIDAKNDLGLPYDIIILLDVIEHIHNQEKLIKRLSTFLKPNGVIFFGFPPWQMPFGGHQQICKSKLLSLTPYYHLLPAFLYKSILRAFGESNQTIDELIEIKETGISLDRFEDILRKNQFTVLKRNLYLINPIYELKFNIKKRKQLKIVEDIPFVRNFVTSCGYYLIRPRSY